MLKRYLLCLVICCPLASLPVQATALVIVVGNAIPVVKMTDSTVAVHRQFEPGFREKYKGSEFKYNHPDAKRSQWQQLLEWLDRFFGTDDSENNQASITTIVIRTFAVLILLFVIYIIVASVLNKEGFWIFGRTRRKIGATDIEDEDIHHINFAQLISETKNSGDNRLAVRYYYLWLLKKMSLLEIISWHHDKTNSDYLYEIKDTGLKKDFEYLSYLYDYSWYGKFPIEGTAFTRAENAFLKNNKHAVA